eukprot:TRINITY_DN11066_c0_g1_i1.p1 TRINITY_DN11066_c0_g1~~TRINITY_DN11066_c0_g1_i1.p1  ORF type:complete len:197 (-),score=24.40 TRINITY_DN11066_c0_g1_i1:77-667(-)
MDKAYADMKIAWMNEKCAPELLPYVGSVVSDLLKDIAAQQEQTRGASTPQEKFTVNLYEMEFERIRYVIRSYLRIRLAKIDRYFLHIFKNESELSKLSENEITYAQKYSDLVEAHLHTSLLQHIPEKLHKLDDKTPEFNMVPAPDLDLSVFCRVNETVGRFEIDDTDTVSLEKDDVYILRYRPIRPLIGTGQVQLI